MSPVLAPVGLGLLAIASVGLWTLRVAVTARGRRNVAALVAAVEAVAFIVAFSHVAAHLDSPVRIAGYAAGVAVGTIIGLSIDRRVSAGMSEVDIIVQARDADAADRLRSLGWSVTTFGGDGPSGPVIIICIVVADSRVAELTEDIHDVAPDAHWTVQRLGATHGSAHHDGLLQIADL